ncbi:MAG TPA: NAD-dependent epimerase/dehydratase family protein [Clostridia bacterium]|nr:NAD-dependent epimerase/dehydratase family protein [Clostridia bacterium]
MKRILITGANSYIGTSFENYIKQWPEEYQVDTIDMIDGSWREKSFVGYDAIFHVAGIAHMKETRKNAPLYYMVNCDLAVETACKSKADGVKQFVFLSSMSVYGMETGVITRETQPAPKTHYGKSKLEAEKRISVLADENYSVAILRPPMVYGKGCKGNFKLLEKLSLYLPIFPYIENQRSMLYIENLTEFVRLIIENNENGLFWPQNAEYSNTSLLVKDIALAHKKRVRLFRGFMAAIKLAGCFTKKIGKAFGSLIYDASMSIYKPDYRVYSLSDSIVRTVE